MQLPVDFLYIVFCRSYTTQVPNSNSRPLRGQVLPSGQPRWSFTGPPPANTAIPPPSVLSPSLPQSGSYPIPSVIPPTSSLNYPVLVSRRYCLYNCFYFN